MFRTLAAALFASLPVSAFAQSATPFVGAHGATTPGSYTTSSDGSSSRLDLWPDQSFHLTSGGISHAGRWHADPSQGGLVLNAGDQIVFLEVRNAQRLKPEGAADDGSQDLELSDTFSPGPIRLPLSGMLTYIADAATIVHCATGRTYPVAQDGDWLALERAYLEDRPGPAEPLFVTMDALIETREQTEGPDRLTVVPEALGSTFPGEDCSLGTKSLDLHEAVWTITSVNDIDLDPTVVSREPSMSFNANEETFLASVGCNTMRGGFSTSGSDLSFAQPMASTMMACPVPVAEWENRLGEALASVATYELGGKSLRLLDADGNQVAALRAVYLP